MVWYGMVWDGMVWYGMVWQGLAGPSMAFMAFPACQFHAFKLLQIFMLQYMYYRLTLFAHPKLPCFRPPVGTRGEGGRIPWVRAHILYIQYKIYIWLHS